MGWFKDLSPYTYLNAAPTKPPTLNVGWLSKESRFPTGDVPPGTVDRLGMLVELSVTRLARGTQECEFCPASTGKPNAEGNGEIRLVAPDGTRFAAPALIAHYVEVHQYQPPPAFLKSLFRAKDVTQKRAFAEDICLACGQLKMERVRESVATWKGSKMRWVTLECGPCGVEYVRRFPLEKKVSLLARIREAINRPFSRG